MTAFFSSRAWLPDVGFADDVLIRVDSGGTVTSVDAGALPGDAIRLPGAVLPGMPNLHSHAHQRAMAGLSEYRASGAGEDDSFWTWRQVMHAFVEAVTPDDLEAIAAQLYVEMLKVGYTAVAEFHYVHNDRDGGAYADPAEMSVRIAAAAVAAGIGLTLMPVLYATGGYGNAATNAGQRRFLGNADHVSRILEGAGRAVADHPDMRLGLAPHSPRHAPADQTLACITTLDGLEANAPIHVHVAEQEKDVDESVAHTGLRQVEWLMEHLPIDERWCLVHATHVNAGEVEAIAHRGAIAGLCPTTEANLGDGLFPLRDFLTVGGRFGIGSDSHISVGVQEELRWLEYGQRLIHRRRNLAAVATGGSTGRRLFEAALDGGAQATGRAIGAIRPGHRADLVAIDDDHPLLAARGGDRLLDSWIFSGNAATVTDVVVGGRQVIRDGRHADEDAIARRFKDVLARVL